MLTTTGGVPTNAIKGYYAMIMTLIKNYNPAYMVATFDVDGHTFRNDLYDGYKANRKGMPDDLAVQVPIAKELLTNMGIKIIEKRGYEADDIIGTLAKRFGHQKIIVSGDRDSLQLIDDTTAVLMPKKGLSVTTKYTSDVLLLEYGLTPAKVIVYKALAGDSSDCIVGVPGIGEKSASELLSKYNDLDEIYNSLPYIKEAYRKKLIAGKESAYLSKKLATIDINVPIECELEDLRFNKQFFSQKLKDQLLSLELYSALNVRGSSQNIADLFDNNVDSAVIETKAAEDTFLIDPPKKTQTHAVKSEVLVNSIDELRRILDTPHTQLAFIFSSFDSTKRTKNVVINLDLNKQNTIRFAFDNKTQYIISDDFNMLSAGVNLNEAFVEFKNDFESSSVHKIVFDIKTLMHVCKKYDIVIKPPYDDLQLQSYLLNSNETPDSVDALAKSFKVYGSILTPYFFNFEEVLTSRLKTDKLDSLYNQTELPLVEVLFEMEKYGFVIDVDILKSLDSKFSEELAVLEKSIYKLAGYTFNINSPAELSDALFNKLNLKHGKKNKSTNYSVAQDILTDIENDHPIIPLLLRYKKLFKLRSTYVIGISDLVDPSTKRVHTTFKQCLTTTGRLSSVDPNLQNIPVRSEEGKEIRKMFVAPPGKQLISADYSQIELRLLAHFSGDPVLKKAYDENMDIHAFVASQIFNVPESRVTASMRKEAKAVNFGIIYGISAFGLANNIGCTNHEARMFQAKYFQTYPLVKKYMDSNVQNARTNGFIRTPWGRIRYFKNMNVQAQRIRTAEERAAMNMPLQAAAADIIKIAMIMTFNALKKGNYKSRLILQVHDELILEVPSDEVANIEQLLKNCMENAVSLDIPLLVDISKGSDWFSVI
jgi:DNA polymerase-1